MPLSFPGPPVPQFRCFQGLWFHLAHPGPCLWPWPVTLPLYDSPTPPPQSLSQICSLLLWKSSM
jgi:hypothetical protein